MELIERVTIVDDRIAGESVEQDSPTCSFSLHTILSSSSLSSSRFSSSSSVQEPISDEVISSDIAAISDFKVVLSAISIRSSRMWSSQAQFWSTARFLLLDRLLISSSRNDVTLSRASIMSYLGFSVVTSTIVVKMAGEVKDVIYEVKCVGEDFVELMKLVKIVDDMMLVVIKVFPVDTDMLGRMLKLVSKIIEIVIILQYSWRKSILC